MGGLLLHHLFWMCAFELIAADVYLGCYVQNPGRRDFDKNEYFNFFPRMASTCAYNCRDYPYYGIEAHECMWTSQCEHMYVCLCGHTYNAHGEAPRSDCKAECEDGAICGGGDLYRYALYANAAFITPEPPTPTPETTVPLTAAPEPQSVPPTSTSAPATPPPPTSAPATSAPATSAPATPAPATPAPATPSPAQAATTAPAASAPATPAPAVGATSAPATSSPASSNPATASPAAHAHALYDDTPAPPTSAPASPAPMKATSAPVIGLIPAPSTSVSTTSAPATAFPATAATTDPVASPAMSMTSSLSSSPTLSTTSVPMTPTSTSPTRAPPTPTQPSPPSSPTSAPLPSGPLTLVPAQVTPGPALATTFTEATVSVTTAIPTPSPMPRAAVTASPESPRSLLQRGITVQRTASTPLARALGGSAGATAAVAVGVAGAGAGPVMRLLMTNRPCRDALKEEGYSPMLHPTGLRLLGSDEVGMVAGNVATVAVSAILGLVLVRAVRGISKAVAPRWYKEVDSQGLIRFPSSPLVVFGLLYQGTVLGGMLAVVNGPSSTAALVGAAGLAVCVVVPLCVLKNLQEAVPLRGAFCQDPKKPGRWLRFLIGPGEWVSRSVTNHWARRWQGVIRPYAQACVWFGVLDAAAAVALAGINALNAATNWECGCVKLAGAAVLAIIAFAAASCAPFARERDHWAFLVVHGLQVVSLVFLACGYLRSGERAHELRWETGVSERIGLVAGVVLLGNGMLDVLSMVVCICMGRKSRLQEWYLQQAAEGTVPPEAMLREGCDVPCDDVVTVQTGTPTLHRSPSPCSPLARRCCGAAVVDIPLASGRRSRLSHPDGELSTPSRQTAASSSYPELPSPDTMGKIRRPRRRMTAIEALEVGREAEEGGPISPHRHSVPVMIPHACVSSRTSILTPSLDLMVEPLASPSGGRARRARARARAFVGLNANQT